MAKTERNPRGYSSRKKNTREPKQLFLIVCGGEETEKNYFECFRVPRKVIKVKGLNKDPDTLVNKTIEYKKEDDYDQVWCVFDKDDFQNFNSTINKAEKQGFEVAYSNEAFELWYVLHFEFLNSPIPRKEYLKKLNTLLGKQYTKNSDTIYDELLDRQETAIRNSEKLLKRYHKSNPGQDNPSTTVHLLVKALNQQL